MKIKLSAPSRRLASLAAGSLALLAVTAGWGVPVVRAQDLQPMTFAAGQVAGGRANYQKNCASCHGNELEGSGAPALAGEGFSHWMGAPAVDLFDYIKAQMPADRPGSLSNAQVATILAYLAEQNGVPAGGKPIPTNPTALKGLSFGQ